MRISCMILTIILREPVWRWWTPGMHDTTPMRHLILIRVFHRTVEIEGVDNP